jgi:hypothetical protein
MIERSNVSHRGLHRKVPGGRKATAAGNSV